MVRDTKSPFADPAARFVARHGLGLVRPGIHTKLIAGIAAVTAASTPIRAAPVRAAPVRAAEPANPSQSETAIAVKIIYKLAPRIKQETRQPFIVFDGTQLLAWARQNQLSKAFAIAFKKKDPSATWQAQVISLHILYSIEMGHRGGGSLASAFHLSSPRNHLESNFLITSPVGALSLLQQYFPSKKDGIYHGLNDYDLNKVFNRALLTDDDLSAFSDYHELGHADQGQFLADHLPNISGPYSQAADEMRQNRRECGADAYAALRFAQNNPAANAVAKLREYTKVRTLATMISYDNLHDTAKVLTHTIDLIENVQAKNWRQAESEVLDALSTTTPDRQMRARRASQIMEKLKENGLAALDHDQLQQLSAGLTLLHAPTLPEYEAKLAFVRGDGMANADAASQKCNGHLLSPAQKSFLQNEIAVMNNTLAPGRLSGLGRGSLSSTQSQLSLR